jgi:hypothetical protein
MRTGIMALGVAAAALLAMASATADAAVVFSTGNPDGKMAMASRPSSTGKVEIEAADDFPLSSDSLVQTGTFTGLLPSAAPLSSITRVVVEIYRVFPQDSNPGRMASVPTRVNSPSDVAFASRDSASAGVSFAPTVLNPSFTATNSVLNGIHPSPTQTTGGDGTVSGEEVRFDITFSTPINLPAGQYFFVPQVALSSGDFFWLSAPRPIVAPGTPFPSGNDLQAWIRNADLEPDWLRVGTDIVGGATPPTFNGAFSLSAAACPLTVAPTALPVATAGAPYTVAFTATGGTAPYTWLETGRLPDGLALNPSGTLTGNPTTPGAFPIRITALGSLGCAGHVDATLTVMATPSIPTQPTGAPQPTAPAISAARLSASTFRAAPRGATLARTRATKRPPVGATVTYTDSQAATTTFAIIGTATGHRKGGSCVAGAPHRHQTRCSRTVTVAAVTHRDVAGANKVRFTARVRGLKLAPGRYRLALTPKVGALAGATVTLAFRIAS